MYFRRGGGWAGNSNLAVGVVATPWVHGILPDHRPVQRFCRPLTPGTGRHAPCDQSSGLEGNAGTGVAGPLSIPESAEPGLLAIPVGRRLSGGSEDGRRYSGLPV